MKEKKCLFICYYLVPKYLSLCTGHFSLWTGSRLFQRGVVYQVLYYSLYLLSYVINQIRCEHRSCVIIKWLHLILLNYLLYSLSLCSSANKCLLKVANYAAQMEQYQKAIEIYEQVCVIFCQTSVHLFYSPFMLSDTLCLFRLGLTPWTLPCWSMVLKTISSKQRCVTSVWTCSTARWRAILPVHSLKKIFTM